MLDAAYGAEEETGLISLIQPVTRRAKPHARVQTTLLELVWVLSQVTQDEKEIVEAVFDLVRTGRVRLSGSFRAQVLQAPCRASAR
jgi:hypothetical protein